ncbi:MAG TPA: hypothetical protein EYP62_00140 [Kiritimatiellae bacterium]|nr:hypothetical protein [Kiritimatiellia bacterium]
MKPGKPGAAMVSAVVTVVLAAGGCDPGPGWYRDARELKRIKQRRIGELESQELTREQAERQWNLELSIRQTEAPPATDNSR